MIWTTVLVTAGAVGLVGGEALARLGMAASTTASPRSAPSPRIPTPALNDRTRSELAQAAIVLADQMGIDDPPHVDAIAVVPDADATTTQIGCLRRAGYLATATAGGAGISYPEVDPASGPAMNLAIYTCDLQYPTPTFPVHL